MNLTSLPEDCSLEDIHSHLYVLISIGTALAEAQRWMNIPAMSLQNRETQERVSRLKQSSVRKAGWASTAPLYLSFRIRFSGEESVVVKAAACCISNRASTEAPCGVKAWIPKESKSVEALVS